VATLADVDLQHMGSETWKVLHRPRTISSPLCEGRPKPSKKMCIRKEMSMDDAPWLELNNASYDGRTGLQATLDTAVVGSGSKT
jgi:hypothetical protein